MLKQNETLAYVIADLRDRAEVGFKKYGHAVEDSPDDMMQHLYEELLDAAMYIKTEINRKKFDNTIGFQYNITFNKESD